MAKQKRGPETVGGYFRMMFLQRPDLVKGRSNDEIQALWERDHPGEKMTSKIKNNMANVKSQMRRKLRKGGRKKASESTLIAVSPGSNRRPSLGSLEVAIDDCMTMAKIINREQLELVIQHLRRARNLVVYQTGEKQ